MNEWMIITIYERLLEAANRNGFNVKRYEYDRVILVTSKEPYAKDTTVVNCANISEALRWLDGYEQHTFELENTK